MGKLVLSREVDQWIEIWHKGELCRVGVSSTRPGKVRLMFDGPTSFEIRREELSQNWRGRVTEETKGMP